MKHRAGEPGDYVEAFRDLYAKAFRVGERLSGSPFDAEDIASEAMARALAAWDRVGALPYRDAWVQRVAANVAVDLVRKRKGTSEQVVQLRDATDGVDLQLMLSALLARLPRRQREVVTLRYLVGLPESDVASLLRLSAGSVKRHASRGLSALRSNLTSDSDLEVSLVFP